MFGLKAAGNIHIFINGFNNKFATQNNHQK